MEKYSSLRTRDIDSAESLLSDGDTAPFDHHRIAKAPSWLKRYRSSLLLSVFFLGVNVMSCFLVYACLAQRYAHHPFLGDTPARDSVRYEGKQLDLLPVYLPDGTLNPEKPKHYNGKPTPELAADWKSIMQHQNIRLQREELGPFADDDSVIQLADGSGYYVTLAVFHGLHCLKRFHHYIHRDSYYPNMTEENSARLLYHTEHCVDWLRQYVQCNADTTLIPFYWGASQKLPLAVDKFRLNTRFRP